MKLLPCLPVSPASSLKSSRRKFVQALLAVCSLASSAPRAWAQAPKGADRWEKDLAAFEAADKASPPPKDATLFVGASNIRRWTTLTNHFRNQKVINRGFGGSQLADVARYTDRIVIPYAPKNIVLQAGGNDLNAGRSPEQVLAAFKELTAKVHARLPKTTMQFISIPPSEARWEQTEKIKEANRLVSEFVKSAPQVSFLDAFPKLLGSDGRPRKECYVEDKLHFSEAGYEVLTSLITWDKEIRTLLAADKKTPPPQSGIVFIGSSSIKRWTTLAKDFPDRPVVNRGFGGSQIFDSVTYADELVTPLQPRLVVMYAGGNDINAGKTPQRVFADFQAFVAKVHAKLPETRIAFISSAPNPARWAQIERVRELNRLVEDFTKQNPKLTFINVHPHMLAGNVEPKPDIFVADRLHMNEKGYAIWAKVVEPFLK